jgi:hypothetical protein
MNREKMLELADIIENVKDDSFHMGNWFGEVVDAEDLDDFFEMTLYLTEGDKTSTYLDNFTLADLKDYVKGTESIKLECGTTACLAGWVVANEWFKNDNFYSKEEIESKSVSHIFEMAKDILGLTPSEAHSLFNCHDDSFWDYEKEYYDFHFSPDYPETWKLDNKKVAIALRDIANGRKDIINYIETCARCGKSLVDVRIMYTCSPCQHETREFNESQMH